MDADGTLFMCWSRESSENKPQRISAMGERIPGRSWIIYDASGIQLRPEYHPSPAPSKWLVCWNVCHKQDMTCDRKGSHSHAIY